MKDVNKIIIIQNEGDRQGRWASCFFYNLTLPGLKYNMCFLIFLVVCEDNQFISNKICVNCSGHCKDGTHCNKLTGMCDNGCANQWTGSFCNSM